MELSMNMPAMNAAGDLTGAWIPMWTPKHADESDIVQHNGENLMSLGRLVRIKDVLPERRWAIDEEGNTLPQMIFEKQFTKWAEISISKNSTEKFIDDLSAIHIPNIEKFLLVQYDEEGIRLVPMHFDPMATGEAQYTGGHANTGETMQEFQLTASKKALDDLLDKKLISLEAYGQAMRGLGEETVSDPAPAEFIEESQKEEPVETTAKCGKKVNPQGLAAHEHRCEKCKQEE